MLRLSIQYYFLSLVLFIMIRILPLRKVIGWLGLYAGENKEVSDQYAAIEQLPILRRIMKRIRRFACWRFKCLEQSLLIMHFCRKHQIPATIYLGANKESGQLQAHAWVVLANGNVLDNHKQKSYNTLACYRF